MVIVKPWDKESERIFKQLSLNGKAFSKPNGDLKRKFGSKYRSLFDNNLLDTATTRYGKRPDKTIFITPEDVVVIPKMDIKGIKFEFKRIKKGFDSIL